MPPSVWTLPPGWEGRLVEFSRMAILQWVPGVVVVTVFLLSLWVDRVAKQRKLAYQLGVA